MLHARWLLVTCVAVCLAAPPQTLSTFQSTIRPFLAQHCLSCHNAKTGRLNLGAFSTLQSLREDRAKWEMVLQKLQSGEIPPKGLPCPSETERKAAV
jgi:hypothetical protein